MATVSLPGLDVHVEERGSGPALLLIAGIPAVAGDWAPLAEPLGEHRRVIAYDNRGSGASTVTPGPYTTCGLAEDAAALLDALGVQRADVLHERIPRSTLRVIPGAGHLFFIEDPERSLALIEDFLT